MLGVLCILTFNILNCFFLGWSLGAGEYGVATVNLVAVLLTLAKLKRSK